MDDTSTDYAIDFLTKHKDQPFCLAVAFKSVHGPTLPNTQDKDLYKGVEARPVPNLTVPASFRIPYGPRPNGGKKKLPSYFECLAGADRDLGRIFDTLDSLGLTGNTMVIFSSDNGYDLGEHEMGDKRSAYEESMRIPFLVRAPFIPNTAGKVVPQMVLNVDVAPTMLDYAGVPIPKTMQGRSIRPLLEQKTVTDWSRAFLYEYFFEKTYLWPTMVAVRTDDSKLITYTNHPEWTELFKLDADPYEINNLAGKPDAKALQDNLQAELKTLEDTVSYVVPGDSDKDTYVEDAQAEYDARKDKPNMPTTGRAVPVVPDGKVGPRHQRAARRRFPRQAAAQADG